MESIGEAYQTGQGLGQSYRKALIWFRRAAAHGSSEAMAQIGLSYEFAQGVPQDKQKAVYWLKKGAAAGSGLAQLALHRMAEKAKSK